MSLAGKKIVLGVSGGIAPSKNPEPFAMPIKPLNWCVVCAIAGPTSA